MRATVEEQRKILVVDDSEDCVVALIHALAPLGHELVAVSSGERALKSVLKQDFALVLLDILLAGGIDGLQTAVYLKHMEQTRDIPLLFLTGIPRDCTVGTLSDGAADYLRKPVDPWELRAKVAFLLEMHAETQRLRAEVARLGKTVADLRLCLEAGVTPVMPAGGWQGGD